MKKKYLISILITSSLGVVSLAFYFYHFSGGFSDLHNIWGEFGSFFGGIISPLIAILAFITVLYNFDLTKDQFQKNSDESTFFRLLDLHSRKVESVTYVTEDNKETFNFNAFKSYADEYTKLVNEKLPTQAKRLMCHNINAIGDKGFGLLWARLSKVSSTFQNLPKYSGNEDQKEKIKEFLNNQENKWETIKTLFIDWKIRTQEDPSSDETNEALKHIGLNYIYSTNSAKRIAFLQEVHDFFYELHGHVTGHYFRNIHYILEHIDSTDSSEKYAKIFCAQLSRFELALIFYNSLSKMSSEKHVSLLLKYDIFNGLLGSDIFYTPTEDTISNDLNYRLTMKIPNK